MIQLEAIYTGDVSVKILYTHYRVENPGKCCPIRTLQLHSLFCFYLMSEDVRTKTKTFDTHITNFFYYDRLSIEF